MKKKLLILNGSHSDISLIKAGKSLGYYVITTGNKPEMIGHIYADEYYCEDFSDYKKILKLAKQINIDAICACSNDFGAITASYVAKKLKLGGHDSFEKTLVLHHKNKFKEFAEKNKIQTPKAKSYFSIEAAERDKHLFKYPIIVKPVDLTGGKGIRKVNNKEEYMESIKSAWELSRIKTIVIEEFIERTQHSFSTFLVNQKVISYFSDNEYSYLNPYLVSTSGAPAKNVHIVKEKLIQQAEKIAQILKLRDGVFHMQYILKEKEAFILEITRRCSGDFYSYPVEYATEIPWAEWTVKSEIGMDCSEFPKKMQKGFCGRHCIMGNKNGIIKNIKISDKIKNNIYDKIWWWNPGYEIKNFMVDKLGILFLKYDSEEEMLNKSEHINELVQIEYMKEK